MLSSLFHFLEYLIPLVLIILAYGAFVILMFYYLLDENEDDWF